MAVKGNVFASSAERINFYKLSRQWQKRFRIYHNLPFLAVFGTTSLIDPSKWPIEKVEISDIELARLKKTSIDFTLCDENDVPLICIEFDGLQEGFNVGSTYMTNGDPFYASSWRETIMNLKLKVAHGSLFPFFIVGTQHFEDISTQGKVTIVDGIIGEVMARKAFQEKVSGNITPERMGMLEEEYNSMDPISQDEFLQDWLMGEEIECDFEHNPIYTEIARLSRELRTYYSSISRRFVDSPRLAAAKSTAERKRLFDSETMTGAECVIRTERFGDIRRVVWLPNFRTPYFSGFGLTEELAHLIALERLRRLISNPPSGI